MIGELNELFGWFRAATSGWRFIFSKTYRSEILAEWNHERWYYVGFDILCGILGVAITLTLLALLGWIILDITRT